jgi:nucleolar protein 14
LGCQKFEVRTCNNDLAVSNGAMFQTSSQPPKNGLLSPIVDSQRTKNCTMAKRKQRSKRSASSLPKGLPSRGGTDNPFEAVHRAKRPKHDVVNRPTSKLAAPSALARSIQQRQSAIQAARKASQSANVFQDKRLGEYNPQHSQDDKQIARLVRERSQRSKRTQKYNLDDGDREELLTHKGKTLDKLTAADHIILSDDEDDDFGGLETDLHFGGGTQKASIYGHSVDMADVYAQRKNDLDDIIMRRKIAKAERLESKHMQEEKIETMDEQYQELANLLQFRDKEKEIREYTANRRNGTLTKEDEEFEEWNKELKTFQFASTKVKATDRTKTAEELAKDEAERLQELETRRIARMNGEFDSDSLADVSDDEGYKKKGSKRGKTVDSAETLGYSDDDERLQPRFTPDGMVMINKDGVIVKKLSDIEDEKDGLRNADADADADASQPEHAVGTKVRANYHAHEQFDGHEAWFDGTISEVHRDVKGRVSYDVTYDDGDFEEDVLARHVRLPGEANSIAIKPREEDNAAKAKISKAKARARYVDDKMTL